MINIVKIGGNIIDNPNALKLFLTDFSNLPGKKILIHGGGKEATRLSKALGIETQMIDGRRITDKETLDVVTMVYAGLINKRIVAILQADNCNAIGLSGADGNSIPAKKRNPTPVDYGFVGDIEPSGVSDTYINQLLESGLTPVFCAICHDRQGNLLNCNADGIASVIAIALSKKEKVKLTYCFEKPGVLLDVEDNSSLIPLICEEDFSKLKEEGKVAAGMIPKIDNALKAIKQGVKEVRICAAENIANQIGTSIK